MASSPSVKVENNYNGCFEFANNKRSLDHRFWNAEYWELYINKDKGRLQFIDAARGLSTFEMAIRIKIKNKSLSILFDSIIFPDFVNRRDFEYPIIDTSRCVKIENTKFDTIKKNSLLLKFKYERNHLEVVSENITRLQYKIRKPGIVIIKRIKKYESDFTTFESKEQ